MEERTCKVCGKTLPLDRFPKYGKYHRYECKSCYAVRLSKWRKEKQSLNEKSCPSSLSPEAREKKSLRDAVNRARRKEETGTTYRNEKEAEKARAYQRKYQETHRGDPKLKEAQRKGARNYQQRKKMKEQVTILDEFFSSDNDFSFDAWE